MLIYSKLHSKSFDYPYKWFNIRNSLNNNVNYYFIITIAPEKPHRGGSIKYVCMYICNAKLLKSNRNSDLACPVLALSSFEQPSSGAPLLGLAKSTY